jgi:hypothetical protein
MAREEGNNMRYRRSLTGPVMLITIGVLFAMDHIWGWWDFSRTWPIILIAIGVVKLLERLAWHDQDYYNGGPRPWGPPSTPPPPPGTINVPPASGGSDAS